ncbi:hypothetical protein AX15_005104 [Amanita polypyramis BW_CC]|nr:hypothetical protein AX15_005104 [Amanita polypyramis BW_CC]
MSVRNGNKHTNPDVEQNRRPGSSSTLSLAGSTTVAVTASGSESLDIALDVSAVVLTTLKDVSRIPPVPFLSDAAGIAITIIGVVQKARSNKDGFKRLAEDSCELVYAIVRAHKDIAKEEDVPKDLIENLEQLVNTLLSVQKLSQKGTSRNIFRAMFRSGVDAGKIQDYRAKIQQSMRVFGLQTDISLRDTVAKLAAQQVEMMKELRGLDSDGASSIDRTDSGSPPPALPPSAAKPGSMTNSAKGDIRITTVTGDMTSKKASKTTSNTNSHNMMTNSTLNAGNTTTMTTSTHYGHTSS